MQAMLSGQGQQWQAEGDAGRQPSRRCLLLQARPEDPRRSWQYVISDTTVTGPVYHEPLEHQALAPVSRIQAQTQVWLPPQVISRPLDKDTGLSTGRVLLGQ